MLGFHHVSEDTDIFTLRLSNPSAQYNLKYDTYHSFTVIFHVLEKAGYDIVETRS